MNASHASISGPEKFPIHELEKIEGAIRASTDYLNALEERRNALTAELDRITRPESQAPRGKLITFGPAYEYRGELIQFWTAIDVYHDMLRRLWTDFPEQRDVMAAAVSARGSARTYIAHSPAALFPGRTPDWATRFSRVLVPGWYIDTNLSRERMRTLVPVAVEAAGLKWGEDMRAYWYCAEIRIPNARCGSDELRGPAGGQGA